MKEYSASILEPLLASFVVSMVSLVAVGVAPLLSFVRDTAFTSAKEKNRGSSKANFARVGSVWFRRAARGRVHARRAEQFWE